MDFLFKIGEMHGVDHDRIGVIDYIMARLKGMSKEDAILIARFLQDNLVRIHREMVPLEEEDELEFWEGVPMASENRERLTVLRMTVADMNRLYKEVRKVIVGR